MGRWRRRSFQVLVILRRMAARCLSRNVRLSVRWVPSEKNPADAPSRIYQPRSRAGKEPCDLGHVPALRGPKGPKGGPKQKSPAASSPAETSFMDDDDDRPPCLDHAPHDGFRTFISKSPGVEPPAACESPELCDEHQVSLPVASALGARALGLVHPCTPAVAPAPWPSGRAPPLRLRRPRKFASSGASLVRDLRLAEPP